MNDSIAGYLTKLRRELRASRGRKDALVAEAEDHLRETAATIGGDAEAAEREAVERFGPASMVARRLSGTGWRFWTAVHWYLYLAMFAGLAAFVVGGALALSSFEGSPLYDA